jgi:hypothetical protein
MRFTLLSHYGASPGLWILRLSFPSHGVQCRESGAPLKRSDFMTAMAFKIVLFRAVISHMLGADFFAFKELRMEEKPDKLILAPFFLSPSRYSPFNSLCSSFRFFCVGAGGTALRPSFLPSSLWVFKLNWAKSKNAHARTL